MLPSYDLQTSLAKLLRRAGHACGRYVTCSAARPGIRAEGVFPGLPTRAPSIRLATLASSSHPQGAAPDGPVAWMAAEVAERTLRWMENIEWLEGRLPASQLDPDWMDAKALFEQDIYNDAACSAIAGRPLFHNTFSPHRVL